MQNLSVSQAVKAGYASQATIYRDMEKGKVSFTRNGKKRRLIDVSELIRVYGEPKAESDTEIDIENSDNLSMRDNGKDKIITILEKQVTDLQDQVASEKAEKTKLLDMLQTEQEKNKMLMLPKPKRTFTDIINFFRTPDQPTKENKSEIH